MTEPVRTAVADLVVAHHGAVYRAAYRLCGSAADAEDLTQQTFLAAQRNVAQLRADGAARGWLLAILRNCFLKECRKRRPLSAESNEIDLDLVAEAAPIPDAPFDADELQTALLSVAPEARAILHMFYFEELSYREIAEQLSIPAGTVMSRLSRAKQQLRRCLTSNVARPTPEPHLPNAVDTQPRERPQRIRTS